MITLINLINQFYPLHGFYFEAPSEASGRDDYAQAEAEKLRKKRIIWAEL